MDEGDKKILEQLLKVKDIDTIEYMQSYKVDLIDMYNYFYGQKFMCECSYELQCAIFEANPGGYMNLVDAYYIAKSESLRVDKNISFVFYPENFDVKSFIESTRLG